VAVDEIFLSFLTQKITAISFPRLTSQNSHIFLILVDTKDIWQKFEIHPGFQMSGLSVQPPSCPSLLSCLSACLTTGCVNVNYNQQDERCEIGHGSSSSSFNTVKGMAHYRLDSA